MSGNDSPICATVVIPAFNEEAGLPVVLADLERLLPDCYEIIVVDDGSRDGTAAVARRYRCRLIEHPTNRGKGRAIRTGIAAARGDKIIFIDADGSYPAGSVPAVAAALDAYDMVSGSRTLGREHIPGFNRAGNALFRAALRSLYGSRVRDPLTGLYGLRRSCLERMQLGSAGFDIESEIVVKASRMGYQIANLPIDYRARLGDTKLRPLRDGARILRTLLAFVLLYNPTATFIIPGLLFLLLGGGLMTALLAGDIRLGQITLSIHTTMVASILALVGVQAIVFGIATKLYALAHKFTRPDWATAIVLRPAVRRATAAGGALSVLAGILLGVRLVAGWASGGFGDFTGTRQAELVSLLVVFGSQLLFSVGFIAVLAGDVAADLPLSRAPDPTLDERHTPARAPVRRDPPLETRHERR